MKFNVLSLFKKQLVILYLFFMLVFLGSCTAYKKLPYMKNIDQVSNNSLSQQTVGFYEPTIKANDILEIKVNSTVTGAAADFNIPSVPLNLNSASGNVSSSSQKVQDYLVDKDGNIHFPVLGDINVTGMTIEELRRSLISRISPKYITEKPIVDIRFVNYKVSVFGEVARPGVYEAENGQMTILDALASAGDLTLYGKRNNVLLLRTNDDGSISKYRINLQDEEFLLNKDIFYLRQNDKLYVETNKAKGNNSQFGTLESVGLSIVVSLFVTLITTLVFK